MPATVLLAVAAGCGVESTLPASPTAPAAAAPGSSSAADEPVGAMTRGPYLQHADDGVTVVWYTSEPTAGRVRWRADRGATGEAASSGISTRHESVIAPLQPGSRYTYSVSSALGRLAAPGGASEFAFQAPQPDVLRMVVFGDSGEGSPAQDAIARAIEAEPVAPDLVMIVGDVFQPAPNESVPSRSEATYDGRFFAPYRPLLCAIPFYAAMGNHDLEVDNGHAYLDLFTLPRNGPPGRTPESAYWLQRSGALMIVHDTNMTVATLEAEAVPWHGHVARRGATFRLVFQHHPVYGSGPNAAIHPSGVQRPILGPLYTRSGVDVVFSGHDHLYERTKPIGGVVYVTTGAGGAALYPRTTKNAFTAAFVNDRHSYTYAEIRGRTMQLRQMDADRQRIDELQLTKPVAASDVLLAFAGSGSPPSGWDEADFDDSRWPEARASGFASPVCARRRFDLPESAGVAESWLRVRGAAGFVVRLNGREVARAAGQDEGVFPVAPSLLRGGANVLALEGTVDGAEDAPPSMELVLVSEIR